MAKAGLREIYDNELVAKTIEEFGYKNPAWTPRLDKIVISIGASEAKENAKVLEAAVCDPEIITDQKAVITKPGRSVVNFKIRGDMSTGCKVMPRDEKVYEFADRLINFAPSRICDFRDVNPDSFDGRDSYAMSIKEQLIFPEIERGKTDRVRGMDIIFVITA